MHIIVSAFLSDNSLTCTPMMKLNIYLLLVVIFCELSSGINPFFSGCAECLAVTCPTMEFGVGLVLCLGCVVECGLTVGAAELPNVESVEQYDLDSLWVCLEFRFFRWIDHLIENAIVY